MRVWEGIVATSKMAALTNGPTCKRRPPDMRNELIQLGRLNRNLQWQFQQSLDETIQFILCYSTCFKLSHVLNGKDRLPGFPILLLCIGHTLRAMCSHEISKRNPGQRQMLISVGARGAAMHKQQKESGNPEGKSNHPVHLIARPDASKT